MDKMQRVSISRYLAISMILFISLIATLLIILNYNVSVHRGIYELEIYTERLSRQLMETIAIHIWDYSELETERTMDIYMQIEEIVMVEVSFNDRKILKKKGDINYDNVMISETEIFYSSASIGQLRLAASPETVINSQKALMLRLFILTAALIIIIAFSNKFILRQLLEKPFGELNAAVTRIASGNYEMHLPEVPQKDINEIIKGINTLSANIQDRERQIIQNREYLHNILESMPSIIITLDRDCNIKEMNSKAKNSFCFEGCGDMVGKNIFTETDFFSRYREFIEKSNQELKVMEFHKHSYTAKNKEIYHYNIMIYPHGTKGPEGVVIRIDDWTRIVENEEKLKRIQKMEAIGNLGAGLAHDFNNTLMGITGASSLISYKILLNEPIDKNSIGDNLDIIDKSVRRAENIVKQLLTLSKDQGQEFCPVDLNDTIKHICKFCSNSFDDIVKIIPNYSRGSAMVMADPNQIEQVLQNIAINAYHAMTIMHKPGEKQGGTLNFYINNVFADEKFSYSHPEAKENSYWKLSVEDTGVGLDKKQIAKIFEPFFTTKMKGEGTGLGLSMVYNIIQQHNGFIDVYSELGAGTTFNIYLPQHAGATDRSLSDKEETFLEGKGAVLLCDDEEIIRKIGSRMLSYLGFDVLQAKDGREAIEIFKEKKEDITVIVMDVNMPGISGLDTMKEIKKIHNDARIIISSGFSKDARVEEALSLGASAFLSKPYAMKNLSEIMKRIFND